MTPSFNTDQFIADHITFRPSSFFNPDVLAHRQALARAIDGSAVLVIGGAGTIGSAFIQCLLRFHPGKLIVVDINENGLTELVRTCRSNAELQLPSTFKTYPIHFNDRVFERAEKKS